MSNDYFKFKQFTVQQGGCAMKVGSDSVTLGAICDTYGKKRILDIGTGTGLLALMLAQKAPGARIDAIEIDNDAVSVAKSNFDASPWEINAISGDFRKYAESCDITYDLIISNPPYFTKSLVSPDKARNTARHCITLSYEDLAGGAARLLCEDGDFYIILPTLAFPDFCAASANHGLNLHKEIRISTVKGRDAARIIAVFSKKEIAVPETVHIAITEESGGSYTAVYRKLTDPYYL